MREVCMANMYDIVIVGGGPGGYSAALYAARAGLHAVVLEKQRIGGQAVHSENIENYPLRRRNRWAEPERKNAARRRAIRCGNGDRRGVPCAADAAG